MTSGKAFVCGSGFWLAAVLLLFAGLGRAAPAVVGHDLSVRLSPQDGRLEVQDRLRLPAGAKMADFLLHDGLEMLSDIQQGGLSEAPGGVPVRHYRAEADANGEVLVHYAGKIDHQREVLGDGYAGGREVSAGSIGPDGVFLAGSSYWYPVTPDWPYLRLRMRVELPDDWLAVSQGESLNGGWQEAQPQDDLYLTAAPFRYSSRATPWGRAEAYLRADDQALAERYLDATATYLGLYSELIGPYPYAKFALVENFWETGYGMPSFTLLGSRVLRLPFILHSSYPHEILHNWWGNSVYVDYPSGNWAEGLTAYLADHLIAEQQGRAAAYRRDNLQKYADFVSGATDFPLREFRSRHGEASQAVGYGKALMLFHMLRQELGDDAFVAGLRRFYQNNRFRVAGFDDLQKAFEAVATDDLDGFFRQWVERTGAPALSIVKAEAAAEAGAEGYRLRLQLRQTQPDAPFRIRVPVAIWLEGSEAPVLKNWVMDARHAEFSATFEARPVRLRVDPRFDLFRRLDPSEIPPAVSQLFAAEAPLAVLPAEGDAQLRRAYRQLAEDWRRRMPAVELAEDADLQRLPAGRAVWVFGDSNRFAPTLLQRLEAQGLIERDGPIIRIGKDRLNPQDETLVLTAPAEKATWGWVHLHDPAALAGLARKLPHYGKYGYLAFTGKAPENRVKGQWNASGSAMEAVLGDADRASQRPIAPRPALWPRQ